MDDFSLADDDVFGDELLEDPEDLLEMPSIETLAEWMSDGGCEATDGCWVEPDGHCEHGFPSWLLYLGLI